MLHTFLQREILFKLNISSLILIEGSLSALGGGARALQEEAIIHCAITDPLTVWSNIVVTDGYCVKWSGLCKVGKAILEYLQPGLVP